MGNMSKTAKKKVRVGTRESRLAVVQTNLIVNEIKKKHPDYEFEIISFKTTGDTLLDQKLDKIGGKGLFIKELEAALLNGSIDIAVHSLKDMHARLPEGLTIAAVSRREDPRDVLITLGGKKLDDLEDNAVIGTSSARREAQLLLLKPGLVIRTLRGNVITRITRLEKGDYDGIVIAMAGLKRLGLEWKVTDCFDVDKIVPAVGQGVLCVETRSDYDTGYLKDSVHDEDVFMATEAERAFMIKLDGSCSTPLAAHAVIDGDKMTVYGFAAGEDKSKAARDTVVGSKYDGIQLGEMLAEKIAKKITKKTAGEPQKSLL